ncbi:hypothetical protein GIB67_026897 [Kingdonia uniflora]|uniref:Uncharacterized protein n=1 Tax=Kingdonia uniflora TaxID=39325 RepID=A0A7J7M7X5_9MAGN|nr:hypothetical protein GIB67_026897 [Kingdonia uniflora]
MGLHTSNLANGYAAVMVEKSRSEFHSPGQVIDRSGGDVTKGEDATGPDSPVKAEPTESSHSISVTCLSGPIHPSLYLLLDFKEFGVRFRFKCSELSILMPAFGPLAYLNYLLWVELIAIRCNLDHRDIVFVSNEEDDDKQSTVLDLAVSQDTMIAFQLNGGDGEADDKHTTAQGDIEEDVHGK